MFELNIRSDKHSNFQLIRFVSQSFLHVFLSVLTYQPDVHITQSLFLSLFLFFFLSFNSPHLSAPPLLFLSLSFYPATFHFNTMEKLGQIFSRDFSFFAVWKCILLWVNWMNSRKHYVKLVVAVLFVKCFILSK